MLFRSRGQAALQGLRLHELSFCVTHLRQSGHAPACRCCSCTVAWVLDAVSGLGEFDSRSLLYRADNARVSALGLLFV